MLQETLIQYDTPTRVAGLIPTSFWVGSVVAAQGAGGISLLGDSSDNTPLNSEYFLDEEVLTICCHFEYFRPVIHAG